MLKQHLILGVKGDFKDSNRLGISSDIGSSKALIMGTRLFHIKLMWKSRASKFIPRRLNHFKISLSFDSHQRSTSLFVSLLRDLYPPRNV